MLENWCWMKQELQKMSCHYTTLDPKYLQGWLEKHPGEPAPPRSIPDELLESVLASRNQHHVFHFLHLL
jgi:metallopeptidase MepB